MEAWGRFPFGRPNTVRSARIAETTDALVIGAYPSALHVRWTAPEAARQACVTGRVQALAVDVEPEVFWGGASDDFAARLSEWRERVRFRDGDSQQCDGRLSATSPSKNGSSGKTVISHFLGPLDLGEERTSFTDIFPVFMLKRSGRAHSPQSRRQQGDAIRDEFDPFAVLAGRETSSLPMRIPPTKLPNEAIKHFAKQLLDVLAATRPALVVTLGKEVWDALQAWPRVNAKSPVDRFAELKSARYGELGTLVCDGHRADWLPLVHPGALRQSTSGWAECHATWARKR